MVDRHGQVERLTDAKVHLRRGAHGGAGDGDVKGLHDRRSGVAAGGRPVSRAAGCDAGERQEAGGMRQDTIQSMVRILRGPVWQSVSMSDG